MAPAEEKVFHVKCQNMYEGGLPVRLQQSVVLASDIAREYARHYHLLKEYMVGYPEVREIVGATD